ncbi:MULTISPECIES: ABC transporter permease DevC [unclassified Coleofasciculus]|uniref:ABC transporter permease DevC n=1 Tax=unclassified Coleofasciculus TaxID=2692782 RepID=UPI00187E6BEA|nr:MULTISPECIES: ABC transporter permease DevC [unclassified Coleofasciculus]MBE9129598.1 FtsX-like permease family protein [Coleofasciculus sp. LEGE 07081]MBE9151358.1 FtsX-like permease family protein [Coleofasciculus sp. LEGE 07092]
MLGLIKTLQQRTPLGLLQLKHDRMRLLTAITGITFADILIFMQLGFADALYKSNTQYPRILQADLVLISPQAKSFGQLRTFARRRLYQAQDVPGVASTDALYIGSVQWRNPQTRKKTSMLVVGQNPERIAFNLPEVNQQLDTIRLPDIVLFDQASRGDYQDMIAQVEQGDTVTTEIGLRTVTVAGLFEVGASFADDGALITSDQNFLRLFPKRDAGAVSLGLIHLDPEYDPEQVKAALAERLPDDVQVLTNEGYIDFELAEIQSNSPIGFVFNLGTGMGFIVGVVIVYQVLSTDVNSHLAEYATFRAMGYRNTYLLGVIFEEALILSLLGFLPGLGIALGAYQLTAAATALPLAMPVSRAIIVLLLTFVMCGASGAVATRRLQAADPADIF